MVTLASAASAEILAAAGFDWLFVDGESRPIRNPRAQRNPRGRRRQDGLYRARARGRRGADQRALDLGAHGIIVPQVNTAERAAAVVRWSRYAPEGAGGVGLARARPAELDAFCHI